MLLKEKKASLPSPTLGIKAANGSNQCRDCLLCFCYEEKGRENVQNTLLSDFQLSPHRLCCHSEGPLQAGEMGGEEPHQVS